MSELTHKFNNDLLVCGEDVEYIKRKYPTLLHILDFDDLKKVFLEYDGPANAAKRRSRFWGYVTIALAVSALLGASAYPAYETTSAAKTLGLIAAICGVASLPIGYWGLMFGKAKREWLYQRLMTERLRQFHFQTIVFRLPELLASLDDQETAHRYESKRSIWFSSFLAEHRGKLDSRLTALLDGFSEPRLHEYQDVDEHVFENAALGSIFEAYKELRIKHQLEYANQMLREQGDNERGMPAKQQAALISSVTFFAIMLIFIIHLIIAISIPFSLEWAHSTELHTSAMWLAILTLAAKALDEGWQPEKEISRYSQYRASTKNILERFEDNSTTDQERLRIMEEMERLSFQEMREFMRDYSNSRFIL